MTFAACAAAAGESLGQWGPVAGGTAELGEPDLAPVERTGALAELVVGARVADRRHHLLLAEVAGGTRLPDFFEGLIQQITQAFTVLEAGAGQDVAGGVDVQKAVGGGAALIAEAVGDGVEQAGGDRRVPDEVDVAGGGALPDPQHVVADLRVGDQQVVVGGAGGGAAGDHQVHGHAVVAAVGDQVDQVFEMRQVAPIHGGVGMHPDAVGLETPGRRPQTVEGSLAGHQGVVGGGVMTLEAELGGIEAGVGQLGDQASDKQLAARGGAMHLFPREALRLLRTGAGLTQAAASKLEGAPDYRTLSHWENNRKLPSFKLLCSYLTILAVDFGDLQAALDHIEGSAPKRLKDEVKLLDRRVEELEQQLWRTGTPRRMALLPRRG